MTLSSFKLTSISSLSPSFLTLDFPILYTNIETDGKILDKNQSSSFIEKENSYFCDEYSSSIIDIGRTKDYSVSRSLYPKKKLVHTFDKHVTVATTNPSSSSSSSSKCSKRKLNTPTRSIIKENVNAFDRNGDTSTGNSALLCSSGITIAASDDDYTTINTCMTTVDTRKHSNKQSQFHPCFAIPLHCVSL